MTDERLNAGADDDYLQERAPRTQQHEPVVRRTPRSPVGASVRPRAPLLSTGSSVTAAMIDKASGRGRVRRKTVGTDRAERPRLPTARIAASGRAGIVRRNVDLREAIRSRRGEATGQDKEDVAKERATEDFVTGRGARETAESQTVSADPMIDRLKIGDAVSAKGRLGEQGLGSLLKDRRDREASKTWSAPGTSGLDDFQNARQNIDKSITEYGEALTVKRLAAEDARARHKALTDMLTTTDGQVTSASSVAKWDTTQLGAMKKTAHDKVGEIISPMPETEDDTDARVKIASAAVNATTERAVNDLQWMESLLPHTEDVILSAIERVDKSVMNNNMTITWTGIVRDGSVPNRDATAVGKLFKSLSEEIDRKTPFNPDLAQKKLTDGSQKQKRELIQTLQDKSSIKRSITEILAQETKTSVLTPLVKQFDKVDGLGTVLDKGKNRDQLLRIAKKSSRNLAALRRMFVSLDKGDKVEFLLVGDGRHNISTVDDWLTKNGHAWLGKTGSAPTFQPNGTTKEAIEAVAIPKSGSSGPANGGYAGNRPFKNSKGPPDMLLPTLTTDGVKVTYTEYDIKPYHPGTNRGPSRFVKGSDGRYYSTSDHYKSFHKFA